MQSIILTDPFFIILQPFWPTGSGCARGVLSALDAAWMVRSFAQDKPPLQILSERENIYRLLSGTSAENLHKDHAKYTINPSSRYLHIAHKKVREVYHLFDTDDAVNADFSLGSPAADVNDKSKSWFQEAILTFWQFSVRCNVKKV